MQRAYKTIKDTFVNENHVSMFQSVFEDGYYRIDLIVDYPQKDTLTLYKGDEEEREQILEKLKMMNSYEDWVSLPDGSLIRIDHIRQLEKTFEDGIYYLKINFGNNKTHTVFSGTKEGQEHVFQQLKSEIYSIIYDLEKI